jgi:MarR family 2-MHQ and catechol resistance regulon transcriptional repressor
MRKHPAGLTRDASALYDAMTDLIRIYQFRDRDRTGYHGLTITQCYVLQLLLRRGAMPLLGLAEAMRLDKSVVSRVVDGLVSKGAVRRIANPADGRSMLIGITPAGTARYLKVEKQVVIEYEDILGHFPVRVRGLLIKFIAELAVALSARDMSRTSLETDR